MKELLTIEDKKELMRCLCGAEYILSKYCSNKDMWHPQEAGKIGQLFHQANELIRECDKLDTSSFERVTLYRNPNIS